MFRIIFHVTYIGTFLLRFLHGVTTQNSEMMEYCQWDTFAPACPSGSLVLIESATYGRMDYGKCIDRDYGYVGCSTDVLQQADARCSGRRRCDIRIPDEVFDLTKPCPKDLLRYLSASYDCLPVLEVGSIDCRRHGPVTLRDTKGVIGSVITEESGCGNTESPWIIDMQPGQRINITMFDFGLVAANATPSTGGLPISHCNVYMIIKEKQAGESKTICGGKSRVSNVYLSRTHQVEIRVMEGTLVKNRVFMFQYEVIGCPTLVKPQNGWYEQDSPNEARFGCDVTTATWTVRCNGTHWLGSKGNCTIAPSSQFVIGSVSLPYALSLSIIVGIALLIGVCILVFGLLFLRRQKNRRRNRNPNKSQYPASKNGSQKEDAYKVIGEFDPPGLIPPSESSQENEYAYVEDFFPPPPPLSTIPLNKINRYAPEPIVGGPDMKHYELSKSPDDYNTRSGMLSPRGTSIQGPRHPPEVCTDCRDSRHYFELDPGVNFPGGLDKPPPYYSRQQRVPSLTATYCSSHST